MKLSIIYIQKFDFESFITSVIFREIFQVFLLFKTSVKIHRYKTELIII